MRRRVPLLVSLAVLSATALITSVGAFGTASASIGVWTVTQNVLPGLSAATDLGAAAPSTPMSLVVTLTRPNPQGELDLIHQLYTPGSAQFGQFLSVDEFASQFAVPASTVNAATSWLTGGGLSVDEVAPAGDQITVHGTAAQIGALMRLEIHRFSYSGTTFLANTSAPVVPYGLGLSNIIGLNTLQHFSLPARTPQQDTCVQQVCTGITTPADLWSTYQQGTRFTGAGQSVAIMGEGRSDDVIADLRTFEQKFNLPQVPVTVKHPAGDTDFSDDSGAIEWNIDTQSSTGMAPNVSNLTLYFGQNLTDADVAKMFSTWTTDRTGPKQASASFGECETIPVVSPIAGQPLLNPSLPVGQGLGNNVDFTFDQILREAVIHGKTLFASTGDTGSSCPVVFAAIIGAGNGVVNQGAPITNSPASLPWVVGVGGTVLYTDGNGNRSHEYGWNFSGGGSTLFTPAPDYQMGTAGLSLTCLTDPLTVCRGISDVAAQSGDVLTNGYAIVSNGADSVGGGTSLSSPLWAGMWTRIQGASNRPRGNGFANFALYRVGKDPASYARDFFDITSTDPATGLPSSNGVYFTTPGWDYVTGFGAPKVCGLIQDIDQRTC